METQIYDECNLYSTINVNKEDPVATLSCDCVLHNLYSGDNIIGRKNLCDVVLIHNSVSDRHAEISIENNVAILKDYRSTNGTYIRDRFVDSFEKLVRNQKIVLSEGTEIRFGIITCTFSFRVPFRHDDILQMETQIISRDLEVCLDAQKPEDGSEDTCPQHTVTETLNSLESSYLIPKPMSPINILQTPYANESKADQSNLEHEDDTESVESQDLLPATNLFVATSPDEPTSDQPLPSSAAFLQPHAAQARNSVMSRILEDSDTESATDVDESERDVNVILSDDIPIVPSLNSSDQQNVQNEPRITSEPPESSEHHFRGSMGIAGIGEGVGPLADQVREVKGGEREDQVDAPSSSGEILSERIGPGELQNTTDPPLSDGAPNNVQQSRSVRGRGRGKGRGAKESAGKSSDGMAEVESFSCTGTVIQEGCSRDNNSDALTSHQTRVEAVAESEVTNIQPLKLSQHKGENPTVSVSDAAMSSSLVFDVVERNSAVQGPTGKEEDARQITRGVAPVLDIDRKTEITVEANEDHKIEEEGIQVFAEGGLKRNLEDLDPPITGAAVTQGRRGRGAKRHRREDEADDEINARTLPSDPVETSNMRSESLVTDEGEVQPKVQSSDAEPSSSQSKRSRKSNVIDDNLSQVSSNSGCIKLAFTGIEPEYQLAKKIGVEIVENVEEATHLVTVLPLKRTPKLMIGINTGVKYIVSVDWLEDSAKDKHHRAIPLDYKAKYIVRDKEKEKLWTFNMSSTLAMPRGADSGRTGVFSGFLFYVTEGVYGVRAPPKDEFIRMITSGGGIITENLQDTCSSDLARLLVISNEMAVKSISVEIDAAARSGAGRGIYSTEIIFLSVLRQELDLNSCILLPFESHVKPSVRKKNGNKK